MPAREVMARSTANMHREEIVPNIVHRAQNKPLVIAKYSTRYNYLQLIKMPKLERVMSLI
jgi:hypothetical protein